MKYIRQLSLALALVCMSSNSWAVLINVVGTLDTFLASTDLVSSSSANEETWIEGVLGFDITYTQLGDDTSGESGNWEQVTDDDGDIGVDFVDHYAFLLGDDPTISHFLIKTGYLGNGVDQWYLFENEVSLAWAYIDLVTNDFDIMEIDKISHVGTSTGTVPEPSTLVLLSLGLLGLWFNRRKILI